MWTAASLHSATVRSRCTSDGHSSEQRDHSLWLLTTTPTILWFPLVASQALFFLLHLFGFTCFFVFFCSTMKTTAAVGVSYLVWLWTKWLTAAGVQTHNQRLQTWILGHGTAAKPRDIPMVHCLAMSFLSDGMALTARQIRSRATQRPTFRILLSCPYLKKTNNWLDIVKPQKTWVNKVSVCCFFFKPHYLYGLFNIFNCFIFNW